MLIGLLFHQKYLAHFFEIYLSQKNKSNLTLSCLRKTRGLGVGGSEDKPAIISQGKVTLVGPNSQNPTAPAPSTHTMEDAPLWP